MKKFRIENMKRGWFIGDFEPVALKTKDFEVGIGHHAKGERWDKHFHKLAIEVTVILKGKVEINGEIFVKGDIFIIDKNEVVEPLFLEETDYVVVKTISDKNDKHVVE